MLCSVVGGELGRRDAQAVAAPQPFRQRVPVLLWMIIDRIGNLMGALKVEHPGSQNQRFDYEELAEQFKQQFDYAL